MDKTIENTFFKAFELGGVVDKCIEAIEYKYDLGYLPQDNDNIPPKLQHYFDIILPGQIRKETEAFDDAVIRYTDSPLMDEIENNLNGCQVDTQRERYLFSLLKPFNGLCSIYNPKAKINRLELGIEEYKRDKEFWVNNPDSIDDRSGEKIDTIEQARSCDDLIEMRQKEIDRVYFISHRFHEITGQHVNKEGSIEACLEAFKSLNTLFTNRLDALLLTYGIDLMRLQRESGIYLKSHRHITDVDFYIGSRELAQKYINELTVSKYAPTHTELEQPKDSLLKVLNLNNPTSNVEIKKDNQSTKYNAVKVAEIYNFCIETKVFTSTITLTDFISSIVSTDFKEVFNISGTIKSKLKLVIHALSYDFGNDWYRLSASSIGVTPSQCSGANVPSDEWRKQLNAIK